MKKQCRYLMNKKGVSTVELLLIMAALVSVAILFKDSLIDFTQNASDKVFSDPPKAERMTFGGGS